MRSLARPLAIVALSLVLAVALTLFAYAALFYLVLPDAIGIRGCVTIPPPEISRWPWLIGGVAMLWLSVLLLAAIVRVSSPPRTDAEEYRLRRAARRAAWATLSTSLVFSALVALRRALGWAYWNSHYAGNEYCQYPAAQPEQVGYASGLLAALVAAHLIGALVLRRLR